MSPWARFVDSSFQATGPWALAVTVSTLVLLAGFAAVAGIVPDSPGAVAGFFFVVLVYVGALSAVPAIVVVWTLRVTGAPRGWTDALAGALIGPVMMRVVFGSFDFSPSSFKLADLLVAGAGAIGGLAYWYFAGRPARQV